MLAFQSLLTETERPLALVLDSLDQLKDYGAGLMDWIPSKLPENITFLLSAIPDAEYKIVPELKVSSK